MFDDIVNFWIFFDDPAGMIPFEEKDEVSLN